MRRLHAELLAAVATLAGLMVLLQVTVGIAGPGWVFVVAYGVGGGALLLRLVESDGASRLTPADLVTLLRAVLVGGVTALVAEAMLDPTAPVLPLVTLASLALLLDGVDGWVARRTRSVSPHGARFDMELDAWMLAVLSVHAADHVGGWVLLIGAARYLYLAAGWVEPWLASPLPPRYWRKVVAVIQALVLTALNTERAPAAWAFTAAALALLLLAESFGRDVVWQWRHRFRGGGATTSTPSPSWVDRPSLR